MTAHTAIVGATDKGTRGDRTARSVGGAALVLSLTGCDLVDSGVANKVARLQEQYAKEQGVTSVALHASLRNESFTTVWWGTTTLADGLGPDDQARLVARFFQLATAIGLSATPLDGILFSLPRGDKLSLAEAVDGDRATEILTTLNLLPDGSTAGFGGSSQMLQLGRSCRRRAWDRS